jgi:hypothetical protein
MQQGGSDECVVGSKLLSEPSRLQAVLKDADRFAEVGGAAARFQQGKELID